MERANRLANLIADAEQRVSEQVLRYEMLAFDGHDTTDAMRTLGVFEAVLVDLIRTQADLLKRYPGSSSR